MTTENPDVSAEATNTEGNGGESVEITTPVSQDTQDTTESSTDKVVDSGEANIAQINYGEEFPKLEKSYKELQRKFTEVAQDRSSMRREFKSLQDAITSLQTSVSQVTKKPLPSPEQFISDLQTKGIDAIQPFLNDQINPIKESYQKELSDRDTKLMALETKMACMTRRNDTDNYPDFAKLEPEIARMVEDPNCPIDFNRPTEEVIDALYNLVRSKHSSQALLEAEKMGRKKAEENLAKESKTTVAGGGKSAGSPTPNLNQVKDLNKLREIVKNMHGVADRD